MQDICIITKTVWLCGTWRNNIEEDATLSSFWDFCLFEPISPFIYYRFTDGFKTRHISDIVIDCFWNCQESERRETKKHNFGIVFFIFKFFGLLEI